MLKEIIEEVFKREEKNTFTFLTGAGISSDSGIATYRSSDGIWFKGTKFYEYQTFGSLAFFRNNPKDVWQYTLYKKGILDCAKPNISHKLIVDIEHDLKGRFQLITQNVDNLHQSAGSNRVFEIHGNYREIKCSGTCQNISPMPKQLKVKELTEDLNQKEIDALKCPECGSWMRTNILLFDECYDEKTHKAESSIEVAKNTGVLFIIGSYGTTTLPLKIVDATIKHGGYVVDINIEDNLFSDYLSNYKNKLILRGKSIEYLPTIKKIIKSCIEQTV